MSITAEDHDLIPTRSRPTTKAAVKNDGLVGDLRTGDANKGSHAPTWWMFVMPITLSMTIAFVSYLSTISR